MAFKKQGILLLTFKPFKNNKYSIFHYFMCKGWYDRASHGPKSSVPGGV